MKHIIPNDESASICLELSMLLHSGVSTGDALSLLAGEGAYKELFSSMAEQVDSGFTLSAALRESGCFSDYMCGLVQVGEETGKTEEALAALSRFYEDRVRLARRVRSALLYPAVMLALMLVVIGVLLVKVMPVFDSVYASLGARLTGVAAGLMSVGRQLGAAMPVIWVVLAVLAVLALLVAFIPPLRESFARMWSSMLGDRGISRKLNNARLAQAMAMGMASGLPLEQAVDLAAGLVQGGAKKRCEHCRLSLEDGAGLSDALRESDLLPPRQCRLLELGQRSGSADSSMEKIARDLSEEGEAALDEKISRVEPALVLLCSVLVGLILLSVMLPLMHIISAIG